MNNESPMALFHELDRLGLTARVVAGDLFLSPKEKITPELAALLRQHKAEVVLVARLLLLDQDRRKAWIECWATGFVDDGLSQADAEEVAWERVEKNRQTKPPTVLKHCRCQDCRRLRDGCCTVGVLVPGAYPLNAWHYCAEYLGPPISMHTVTWNYDDVSVAPPASHVGLRATGAG